jgi:hypothetical protein
MAAVLAQAQQPTPISNAAAKAATPPARATLQTAHDGAGAAKPQAAPPAVTPTAAQPADSDAQLVRDARDAGFRVTSVRGSLMFCRLAVELGSNFPVRTCYNSQQVRTKIQEYRTQRNQLQQQRQLPPSCGTRPVC